MVGSGSNWIWIPFTLPLDWIWLSAKQGVIGSKWENREGGKGQRKKPLVERGIKTGPIQKERKGEDFYVEWRVDCDLAIQPGHQESIKNHSILYAKF